MTDGNFKNFSLNQTITRSSVAEPIYPRRGSRISLSVQLTPPYSLFRKDNVNFEPNQGEFDAAISDYTIERGSGNPPSPAEIDAFRERMTLANRFEFLEYHKWRVDAEWFYNITGKLVFMTQAKLGFLGTYDLSLIHI